LTLALQGWATADIILRADHFFWLLGANMQKTIEGLLRSLLHSALLSFSRSEIPNKLEAIKDICSLRSQIDAQSVWSRSTLRDMLVRLTSVSGVKFFFLVDALDECEPQDDLGDLVHEISKISNFPNVKLCVSHRTWEIFTRKFEHAPTLRLDRLTLRDMENYVRGRLTSMEADGGRHSDFHDQTQPTQKLIRNLAHAAEGVFLWIELITKAICSEMRKGKRIAQLVQVMADFPTDLDKYFHSLIFVRIGRSGRNIKDTAAALKLAVEINTFEKNLEIILLPDAIEKSPFARSFMDFWLLSKDCLKPGFSWQDYECIVQPGTELMLSQTASFLEETCKDLLVLNYRTKEVDFLHRTVFDFLTDKKADVTLENDVPAHFSDENFIFELAKLRCICILREARTESYAILHALDRILQPFQSVTHLDANALWLLTCESLTILQMQKVPGYRDEGGLHRQGMPTRCVKAGLSKTVLEIYKHMPCLVHTRHYHSLDLLIELLLAATKLDIRSPELMLYRYIMEHGCNPNASVGNWPYLWSERYRFSPENHDFDTGGGFDWCARTTWQAWLGEAYLQTQQRANAELPRQTSRLLDMRKQWLGVLVDLLLRHGADPRCTIFITDHEEEPAREHPNSCSHVALEEILEQIVPAKNIVQLRKLRNICSDGRISHVLRRNQQKRAVRSLLTSERNFFAMVSDSSSTPEPGLIMEALRKEFLESLTGAFNLQSGHCSGCSMQIQAALVTWCVECQSPSSMCLDCSQLRRSEAPSLISPCDKLAAPRASRDEDHTSVVFVWEDFIARNGTHQAARDYADLLHARYPIDKAIAVLKEWYAKNPIEPDLTFEEAIRGIVTLPAPFEPYRSYQDGTADVPSPKPNPTEAASSMAIAGSSLKAPVDADPSPNHSSANPGKVPKRSLRARLKQKFLS
jgi:hypothetical protein